MPIICNKEENIFVIQTKNSSYVIIENCASGGRRADLSISEYCSRINRSDNQNPRDEIFSWGIHPCEYVKACRGRRSYIQVAELSK